MPLPDLVQMLNMRRRTAIIHIAAPPGCGVIHLDEGEVTCARFNADGKGATSVGPAAFARMLALESGSFDVSFGACALERNVFMPTTMLLLDATRVLDEEAREEVFEDLFAGDF